MKKLSVKRFTQPDELRTFPHGSAAIVKVGGHAVGLGRWEPGWRWSKDVKPIVGTASCQQLHTGYVLSGRMHVVTDDGEEGEVGPGDFMSIEPGHDAWVVGDEPCVMVDFTGMETYAKVAAKPEAIAAAQPSVQPEARH